MSSPEAATGSGPQWVEEWLPRAAIIPHAPWQVRHKLNPKAVKRYREMTLAGSVPPPIKVGRVGRKLYLLDGWHRVEAGALQTMRGLNGEEVLALVARLDSKAALWEAAKANMGHGEPLKARDLHGVFKAYVKSGQHFNSDGSFRSYREMAETIGKPHTTVRTWMLKYFPAMAARIGGVEHGNQYAEQPPLPGPEELAEEHRVAALDALQEVRQRLDAVTPEARWQLVQQLDAAREAALALGIREPGPDHF